MKSVPTIIVVFDQIKRDDFFRRLEWPFLIRAWSKSIGWQTVSDSTIRLDLAGIDGLESIFVTRRFRGGKIFIGARDSKGSRIQSGVWEWDTKTDLAVCYRRIYKLDLFDILKARLPDFCCSTFLKDSS